MPHTGSVPPRPRIAVVATDKQTAIMVIRPYVRDAFDLLCVADVGGPEQYGYARLLKRVGPVIDSWGRSPEQLAEQLAAYDIDGVIPIADENIPLASELARRLGLPGHSPETVERLTDKLAQRIALRAGGLRTPRFWRVDGLDDAAAWTAIEREACFPAVLKPRRGAGSRDVTRVGCVAEARASMSTAKDASSGFLLEEYIPDGPPGAAGTGFDGFLSVESLVYRGHVIHVATTGRAPMAPPFRSGGAFVPSALEGEPLAQTLDTATRAITALGVVDGCLHTEVKLTPAGPVIIEVNGRMGGKEDQLTERSSGFPFREQEFRIAAGLPPIIDQGPVPCERVGFIVTQQAPVGISEYAELLGIEPVRTLPGVEELTIDVAPGAPIDWRDGTKSKLFSVEGSAADHDQLRDILAACAAVQIVPALASDVA